MNFQLKNLAINILRYLNTHPTKIFLHILTLQFKTFSCLVCLNRENNFSFDNLESNLFRKAVVIPHKIKLLNSLVFIVSLLLVVKLIIRNFNNISRYPFACYYILQHQCPAADKHMITM